MPTEKVKMKSKNAETIKLYVKRLYHCQLFLTGRSAYN